MTGPTFGIRLTIDSSGSKVGADQYVRNIEDVKGSIRSLSATEAVAAQQLRTVAQQRQQGSQQLVGWFEKESAAIRAKSTVQLSEVQVYRQVRAALEARVAAGQTLIQQEQREVTEVAAVIAANNAAASSAAAASGGIGGVGKAASGAGTGLRTMSTGLASLAASQLGMRAGLGSLIGAVGFFALGNLTTLGVMAGLAAIALGYNLITKDARESKKAIQDVIDKLDEQARAQHQTARLTRLQIQGEVQRVQAELAAAQAIAGARPSSEKGEAGQQQRAIADVIRLEKELAGFKERTRHVEQAEANEKLAAHEKEVQNLVTLIGLQKASAIDLARRKQLIAEDTAALAKAGITLADRARLQSEINTLTEAGIEKTRAAKGAIDAYADSIARARREAGAGGLGVPGGRGVAARLPVDTGAGFISALTPETLRGMDEFDRRRKESADKAKADAIAYNKLIDEGMKAAIYQASQIPPLDFFGSPEEIKAAQQRYEAALRTITDSTQRAFAALFSGHNPFDGLVELAKQAAAAVAAAFTVKSLGLDSFLKELTSEHGTFGSALKTLSSGQRIGLSALGGVVAGQATGNPFAGALGGAASGFAVGGPLGAIAGGVSGFVSGLLGSAAKARQAAEDMRKAQKAWEVSLEDFVALAHPRGALGDMLAEIKKGLIAQQEAALAIGTAQGKVYKSSLHGGRTFEQETALSAVELQKELDSLNKTIREGGIGRAARDLVARLLEIRKAADDAAAAARAWIALQQQQLAQDLNVRALRAQGRDAEADAEAFRLQQAREFAAVVDQFKGTFTAAEKAAFDATIATLAYTQGLEAEAFAKKQAAEAAAELLKQQTFAEDLEVRRLVAVGANIRAIEDMRLALDQERERRQAVTDGISELNLALLDTVQALEAAAVAERRRREELAAAQDLDVRFLASLGQDEAAQELQFLLRQQREVEAAKARGLSQAYLDQLATVQTQERARNDELRRQAQQEAFDRATAAGQTPTFAQDSRTELNLAVGISESTGGRMTGLLASQLAYQASLPRMEVLMQEHNRLLNVLIRIRSGQMNIEDIDEELGILSSSADLANGVPAGNR